MARLTLFNKLVFFITRISPLLLLFLILRLSIKNDIKSLIYLGIIIVIGYLFEIYESHHYLPVAVFFSFNVLQKWLEEILDFAMPAGFT
jgi:hypothetical protein